MSGIFICYRREDTAGHAGRIFDRLRDRFGQDNVFLDVSDIEPGVDFVEAIDRAVGSCDVLLVVIGKQWLICTDASGRHRLDDPKDFIRLETATALRRNIRVIPVLVQGASMPSEDQLPDDMKKLARRQATEITDTHWDASIEQLIATVAKVLEGTPEPALSHVAESLPVHSHLESIPNHDAPASTESARRKRAWIISAIVVFFLAAAGTFYISPWNKVEVPSLMGHSFEEAVARLTQVHLRPGEIKHAPSDRPAESVIEQDPLPGSRLARDSAVTLVLAEKEPESLISEVPNLIGLSLETALQDVRNAGLVAAEPVRKESREFPEGTVLAQIPGAGEKLDRGGAIKLVVAASPAEPAMVKLPDVTGMDLREALRILKNSGLKTEPKLGRVETTRAEPGIVLKQSFRPGSQVRVEETVSLDYAVAPPDNQTTGGIILPDFTNWPIERAREYIVSKGLILAPLQEKAMEDRRPGNVVAQRPPAATPVRRGTTVTLVVAMSAGNGGTILPAPFTNSRISFDLERSPQTAGFYWKPVTGAASYTVELDCFSCCVRGKWCSDTGKAWNQVRGIEAVRSPGCKLDIAKVKLGRWRVWAVDRNGRDGEKSAWHEFQVAR